MALSARLSAAPNRQRANLRPVTGESALRHGHEAESEIVSGQTPMATNPSQTRRNAGRGEVGAPWLMGLTVQLPHPCRVMQVIGSRSNVSHEPGAGIP